MQIYLSLKILSFFFFTTVISELKFIGSLIENSVIGWVSDFTLLKLLVVGKKDEKIRVLTLEMEVLPGEKTIFVYYWFDVD